MPRCGLLSDSHSETEPERLGLVPWHVREFMLKRDNGCCRSLPSARRVPGDAPQHVQLARWAGRALQPGDDRVVARSRLPTCRGCTPRVLWQPLLLPGSWPPAPAHGAAAQAVARRGDEPGDGGTSSVAVAMTQQVPTPVDGGRDLAGRLSCCLRLRRRRTCRSNRPSADRCWSTCRCRTKPPPCRRRRNAGTCGSAGSRRSRSGW